MSNPYRPLFSEVSIGYTDVAERAEGMQPPTPMVDKAVAALRDAIVQGKKVEFVMVSSIGDAVQLAIESGAPREWFTTGPTTFMFMGRTVLVTMCPWCRSPGEVRAVAERPVCAYIATLSTADYDEWRQTR